MTERAAHVKVGRRGRPADDLNNHGEVMHLYNQNATGTAHMGRDLSPYKILVVDDEADVRAFICTVLADSGATVLDASDGDEAMAVARREVPDLITLDITMPGKDGGEVFDELRNDPTLRNIPVCIISADPDLRRLIYQRTVPPPDGYLDKPIDEKGLLLNVRKTLALARRGRQDMC
jgi:CheY-like chemotaxis protein